MPKVGFLWSYFFSSFLQYSLQLLKRSGPHEKVLVIVRKRASHQCDLSYLVCSIVIWEGLPTTRAESLYKELTNVIPENAMPTVRRCCYNDRWGIATFPCLTAFPRHMRIWWFGGFLWSSQKPPPSKRFSDLLLLQLSALPAKAKP
jgi:hypothetical protein